MKGLRKKFGKKEVVCGVDLQVRSGEVVGFLGPNGAGKTTIFYMIVGFIRVDRGSILLNGHNLTHVPMYKRARAGISYLPQEPSVFRAMTVEQNIRAVLETRKDLSIDEQNYRLDKLLSDLGIEKNRKQRAYTLSGGERRRTEIARSLAIDPLFLLLDEPFAAIDPIAVYEIKSIVQDLAHSGISIIVTDHNVRDALEITDRSYIINNGTIAVEGSKEEIMENELARRVYLGHTFQM